MAQDYIQIIQARSRRGSMVPTRFGCHVLARNQKSEVRSQKSEVRSLEWLPCHAAVCGQLCVRSSPSACVHRFVVQFGRWVGRFAPPLLKPMVRWLVLIWVTHSLLLAA